MKYRFEHVLASPENFPGVLEPMVIGSIVGMVEDTNGNWVTADEFDALISRYASLLEKYNELLMCAANKHPGKTRHETALSYIRNAERLVVAGESVASLEKRRRSDGLEAADRVMEGMT